MSDASARPSSGEHVATRIARLLVGLPLYGIGCGLVLIADLGVEPWTVLAQGISVHTGIGVGWVTNIIGAALLLLWIPLRERPGLGTILNVLLTGTFLQFTADLLPHPENMITRLVLIPCGIAVVALGSGIYLGAAMGAGPRDGLMRGLARRFHRPIWQARVMIEVTVLAVGWMLGGTVGIGTVAFALLIGPAVQAGIRWLGPRPGTGRRQSAPR